MGDIGAGIAEVAAHTGTKPMKNDLMVTAVMEEGIMTGTTLKRTGAGKQGAAALASEERGAGALGVGGTGFTKGKAALREGPKLNSGTGKENRLLLEMSTTTTLKKVMHITESSTMTNSHKEDMLAIRHVHYLVYFSSFPSTWTIYYGAINARVLFLK